MKEFALTDKCWIYHRNKHVVVFQAAVVLVQYDMETTCPLFDIY